MPTFNETGKRHQSWKLLVPAVTEWRLGERPVVLFRPKHEVATAITLGKNINRTESVLDLNRYALRCLGA